jgi:PAS domain S-box-containing protein
MFGYQHDLEGVSVDILLPEKMRKMHAEHRKDYNKDPKVRAMGQDLDLFAARKNGSVFPVEVSLSPCKIDDVPVTIAFIIDITERKKREQVVLEYSQKLEARVEERTEELRESQKLYSAIARNFPEGMISVFDKDFRYVFVEGKELYSLGITSDMLMGTRYMDRLPPEVAKQTEDKLLEVFNGKARSIEIKFKHNYYILDAVPIPDEKGSIPHILVIEKNITKRKMDEEKVRRALDHERELNELKSRFVSTASHEFRTPLSTILSSVSLLSRYTAEEDQAKREKHIQRIKTSVHNLTGILNDFLSLDKLETGVVQGNPVLFELEEFIEDVCDQMASTLKKEQTIEYQHTGKPSIYLDKQILNNILFNLLSNASKYSGPAPIELSTNLENGQLVLMVRDHGLGISEEDQKHLFQRFFRSKSAINIPGTGLGLNIVKKYIELLGGEIQVTSELGQGSTFTVTLNQSKEHEENTAN